MGIFGIVLGVLGIIAAAFATLMGGWIGGAFAILLGVAALALGFACRKKGGRGGMGAIVTGVIGVILAVALIFTTQNMMVELKSKLLEEIDQQASKHATVAKYCEMADTNTGLVGFVTSMASKVTDEDKDAFNEEIKDLTALLSENTDNSGSKTTTETVTEAPAEPAAEGTGN